MHSFKFETNSEAYLALSRSVIQSPDVVVTTRERKVWEMLDVMFTVKNPNSDPIVTLDQKRNEISDRYIKREFQLYESGTRDSKKFSEAAKFWESISNPDGTVNSAYGWLIWKDRSCGHPEFENFRGGSPVLRTGWEWALQSLQNDKHTRQAVIPFMRRDHLYRGNKDVTCTLHANFSIRSDTINLSVVMRSNDLRRGLLFDLPWFCHIQQLMLNDLSPAYPDLKLGSYTHHAHSLHLYEDDLHEVEKMVGMVANEKVV